MNERNHFTKDDIDTFLTKQPLWTKFVLQPLFKPLILFFVNQAPWVHPNFITIISLLFSFLEIYFFSFVPGYMGLLFGAIFFEIAYFLDCIDGPIARMLNKNSKFGTALDISADSLRLGGGALALVLKALSYSTNPTSGKEILFWGIILITCHMASMWIGYKQLFDSLDPKLDSEPCAKINRTQTILILKPIFWLINFFSKLSKNDRNYWLFPTSVELETVVYFILPLLNRPKIAIIVGGIWSLVNLVCTVVGYVYTTN